MLVTERHRVRFTHPLLASAVYGTASDARRRRLHRHLAEVVMDMEERARHLAQSAIDVDESTASQVEEAAEQAALRGAFDAAAELFEASCRLTPPDKGDARMRRHLGQASSLLRAGDVRGARLLAHDAEAGGVPPALRARRLQLLAEIEWDDGAIGRAMTHLEQALAVAGGDPALSARISARLVLLGAPGNPARAREHAERALRHASDDREPAVLSSLLIDLCLLDLLLGRTPRTDLMERGLALEATAGSAAYPHPVPLIWFQCTDAVDATRARHEHEFGLGARPRRRASRCGADLIPCPPRIPGRPLGPRRANDRAELQDDRGTPRGERPVCVSLRVASVDRCASRQARPRANDPRTARRGDAARREGVVGGDPPQHARLRRVRGGGSSSSRPRADPDA